MLTENQKAFVIAYLGSANKNAKLAAVMSGAPPQTLEIPAVQHALAQHSFRATVVDGTIVDVKPDLDRPSNALGSSQTEHPRARYWEMFDAMLEAGYKPSSEAGTHGVTPPETFAEPDSDKLRYENGEVIGTAKDQLRLRAKKLQARKLDRAAKVHKNLTLDSDDLEEISSARAIIADSKNVKQLAERFDRLKNGEIGLENGDGTVQVYTAKIASPLEIKEFLTGIMRNAGNDTTTRMQAAALLGKSYGMFSDRFIAEDRAALSAPITDLEAKRQRLADARAKLATLKKPGVVDAENKLKDV